MTIFPVGCGHQAKRNSGLLVILRHTKERTHKNFLFHLNHDVCNALVLCALSQRDLLPAIPSAQETVVASLALSSVPGKGHTAPPNHVKGLK